LYRGEISNGVSPLRWGPFSKIYQREAEAGKGERSFQSGGRGKGYWGAIDREGGMDRKNQWENGKIREWGGKVRL